MVQGRGMDPWDALTLFYVVVAVVGLFFCGVGNSFRTLISSSLSKKDRQEWTEAAQFTVVEAWEHLSRGKNMVKVDRVGWAPRTDGVVVLSWQAWPTPCLQNKLLSCRTTRWNIFQNC